jgi:hypothetical protein
MYRRMFYFCVNAVRDGAADRKLCSKRNALTQKRVDTEMQELFIYCLKNYGY